jgi:hypothetical protein
MAATSGPSGHRPRRWHHSEDDRRRPKKVLLAENQVPRYPGQLTDPKTHQRRALESWARDRAPLRQGDMPCDWSFIGTNGRLRIR